MNPTGENLEVHVLTTADNAGLKTTEAEIDTLGNRAKRTGATFDSFNKSLKTTGEQSLAVGRSMSTYVTLPIVALAAESVKMGMNFQQTMELLHTNAGVAQGSIAGLSNSILEMAGQVGQGPEALATAMYHVSSAGKGLWSTTQQLDLLRAAAEGAAVGQADLDDTTYALTSTIAANVKGAKDYSTTMGTLLAIVGAGDMKLSDLNEVIGTGLMGTLSTFGVSIQSAGAALADFGDLGERGAAAGTRLRMMLTLMASPSQAAAKILGDLGLDAEQAGTATESMNAVFAKTGLSTTKLADDLRKPNGIYVAITDLKTRLEKTGLSASETDSVLAKAFGGGKSDAALLQLLNTTDRLNQKFVQINGTAGNFANNWAAQQKQAKQQWDEAWSGIQADMIRLGVVIMPEVTHAMSDVGHAVGDVTKWFQGLSTGQKQFVIDAAGVAAAVGPVLFIFGTLAKSLSEILTLSKTVGVSLGLLGTESAGVSAAGGAAGAGGLITRLLGGAGTAAEVEGVSGSLGGLAAMLTGPVGLALAGTAVAVGGGALLWKHYSDNSKEAAKESGLAADMAKVSSGDINKVNSVLTQQDVLQKIVTAQSAALRKNQADLANTNSDLARKTAALATAEQNVKTAYDRYGANSPQYKKALSDLDKLAQQVTSDQAKQKKETDAVKGSQDALKGAQDRLNATNKALSSSTVTAASKAADLAKANITLKQKTDDYHTAQQNATAVLVTFGKNSPQYQKALLVVAGAEQAVASAASAAKKDGQDMSDMMAGIVKNANGWITKFNLVGLSAQAAQSQAARGFSKNAQGIAVPQFASGTASAPPGWAWVGENGPEMMKLKGGESIKTQTQSKQMAAKGSTGNTYHFSGNIMLGSGDAVTTFFKQLDQDGLLASKGLTVRRGMS